MQRIAKETMKYQELWNTQITDNNSNAQERQAKRTLQNFETNDLLSVSRKLSAIWEETYVYL